MLALVSILLQHDKGRVPVWVLNDNLVLLALIFTGLLAILWLK